MRENRYVGMSKRNLRDIELRLLSELANLRTDSKRARQKLASARSGLAEVKFELSMVEEALRVDCVMQFPSVNMGSTPRPKQALKALA